MRYGFSARNEFMEDDKCSFLIINGKKRDNLYKLIGDLVGCGVTTASKDKVNFGEKLNLKSYYNGNVKKENMSSLIKRKWFLGIRIWY